MRVTILLVGCGKMGRALLEGWLDLDLSPSQVTVVEPDGTVAEELRASGVEVVGATTNLSPNFAPEIVVLAIKPQIMEEVLSAYAQYANRGAVFLTIMAGRTLSSIAGCIGDEAAIVRAMPNTPAAVRSGITVACRNDVVTSEQSRICHDLLEAVGEVAWVDEESLLDAVTGTSGSGPAYVFYMIECLARAGEEAGLSAELAMQLARATVIGSSELARLDDSPAATLRNNVTSPGGTTEAALRVLMAKDGLSVLMSRAVAAATARSRELAG